MKTFKLICCFLLLTTSFTTSVSAENLVISDNYIFDTSIQNDDIQDVSHHGMPIFVDTESESNVSNVQPDILLLLIKDVNNKYKDLQHRSSVLSLVQNCKFNIYYSLCLNQFFIKDIIFPFLSFW